VERHWAELAFHGRNDVLLDAIQEPPFRIILKLPTPSLRIAPSHVREWLLRKRRNSLMSAAPKLSPNALPEDRIESTGEQSASNRQTAESSQSEDIARLAYALSQQRGCPAGSAEIDWLEAEQQLNR
jgi:DUF2934 family protein